MDLLNDVGCVPDLEKSKQLMIAAISTLRNIQQLKVNRIDMYCVLDVLMNDNWLLLLIWSS